ncbi:Rad9/Ddc1, partial [Ochromonadaceae sp. CCMP2298]
MSAPMSQSQEQRRTFFEVSVHADNVKAFSATLHLLQKVGKDLTIEVEASTFTLRALNDAKSAFVGVELSDQFFDSFRLSNELKSFSCKLAVKTSQFLTIPSSIIIILPRMNDTDTMTQPACAIFRSLKGVRLLRLRAARVGAEHELSFELLMINGVSRTYRLRYVDCEVLSAVFHEQDCSYIKASPK